MSKILLIFALYCCVNKEYHGTYNNAFGSNIQLRQDGTFKYIWGLDNVTSWSTGTWKVSNDTLRLHIVPVYDTVALYDSYKSDDPKFIKDTLVLSPIEKAARISFPHYVFGSISSGGQNRKLPDTIFYLKKNKLITIKNGKLQTKKEKDFWGKKHYPWYIKQ